MSEEHSLDKPSEADDSSGSINRRRFVKSLGVAGGATVGLSGVGAATNHSTVSTSNATPTASGKYDAEDVRQILANHEDLLTELADKGLLASGSVDALSIKTLSPPSMDDPDNLNGERVVRTPNDGQEQTEVRISRQTERGALAIVASVEKDYAYATLNPHDDAPLVTILPDGTTTQTGKSIDSQTDGPTTQSYQYIETCRQFCNVSSDCCRCIQKCVSGCNCRCTPSYVYECGCCKWIPPRCSSNC